MPFDRAELHFTEVALYQEYGLKVRIKFFLSILLLCKHKKKMIVK